MEFWDDQIPQKSGHYRCSQTATQVLRSKQRKLCVFRAGSGEVNNKL